MASRALSYRPVNVESFLTSPDDAVIFAGRIGAKSTFLHYIYRLSAANICWACTHRREHEQLSGTTSPMLVIHRRAGLCLATRCA
ncbi:MAG TPA: hypothetical protein VK638_05575, partial [Edaphobacter sp.]|nr:hypothetical protein [Edaphobacter sp.]